MKLAKIDGEHFLFNGSLIDLVITRHQLETGKLGVAKIHKLWNSFGKIRNIAFTLLESDMEVLLSEKRISELFAELKIQV